MTLVSSMLVMSSAFMWESMSTLSSFLHQCFRPARRNCPQMSTILFVCWRRLQTFFLQPIRPSRDLVTLDLSGPAALRKKPFQLLQISLGPQNTLLLFRPTIMTAFCCIPRLTHSLPPSVPTGRAGVALRPVRHARTFIITVQKTSLILSSPFYPSANLFVSSTFGSSMMFLYLFGLRGQLVFSTNVDE